MRKSILMAVCLATCGLQAVPAQTVADTLSSGDLYRGMSRSIPTGRVVVPYGLEVTFEKTVHLIFPAPIRYVDLGSSNIIAEYGALYFSSIFNMAVRIEDPNNYPVAHMSPEIARRTCIVALSVSGETREIVDYLSHFNLTECSIISITSTGTSTVARLSDINIPYHITIEKVRDTLKDEPDITTQVPALYIVETLAREVIKQKADRQN